MTRIRIGFAVAAIAMASLGSAQSYITGGSNTLTAGGANQIASWLGQGPLELTRVFSKSSGDSQSAFSFHAAVDGIGPTITVMQATGPNGTFLIGGYNPQSWQSSGGYTIVSDASMRNAFVFNLTTSTRQMQNSLAAGMYQTYNAFNVGPTFGGGHDIYVDSTLGAGYVNPFSYGTGQGGTNILGSNGQINVTYGNVEVFTINAAPVPEPATLAILGIGALATLRKRRAR